MVQRQIGGILAGMATFQWLGTTDLESETSTHAPLGPLRGAVEGRHIGTVIGKDIARLDMIVAAEATAEVRVNPEAAANAAPSALITARKAVRS